MAAPKGVRAGLKGGAGREAQLPSAPEARRRCNEILADLRDVALRAAMVLIAAMRLYMRTSNYLERLNREIERHKEPVRTIQVPILLISNITMFSPLNWSIVKMVRVLLLFTFGLSHRQHSSHHTSQNQITKLIF